eukprot:3004299-Rhodomonas_salina.1
MSNSWRSFELDPSDRRHSGQNPPKMNSRPPTAAKPWNARPKAGAPTAALTSVHVLAEMSYWCMSLRKKRCDPDPAYPPCT